VFLLAMTQKTETIDIESLFENIFDRVDYIAEVYVAHLPSASEVAQLHITVHTGDADSREEYLDVTTADKVMIDIGDAEPLLLPFDVMATIGLAGHLQGIEGTTVYVADNIWGAEARDLDVGLSILRQKLAGTCPSCGGTVEESFSDHYRDNRTCQESERV
jgi:hypothetical protein